jgi:prephenate dehydrogenase
MTVTIIGVGLMGGSLAISLKEKELAKHIIGVDNDDEHLQKAKSLGLIDEYCSLADAIKKSTLVILAVPVDAMMILLPRVLDLITGQVVMDMGSTKEILMTTIAGHPQKGRFVPTHPMWGTEYSGPQAAVSGGFVNKAVVLCNVSEVDADALALVKNLYQKIGMHLVYMEAQAHDLHAAYVSHISHITSFALANTVLEKEKEEDAIFEIASAGFESTVRLAKSNPDMWVPIFKHNRENVLDVLNEHISQLKKFKSCLEKENYEYLKELIQNANGIKKILE